MASGRVEQNYYVTAGNDNICRLEETFDLRQVTWAVIVDVLASDTSVQLSLISPGGTGVNWGYSENYRALFVKMLKLQVIDMMIVDSQSISGLTTI